MMLGRALDRDTASRASSESRQLDDEEASPPHFCSRQVVFAVEADIRWSCLELRLGWLMASVCSASCSCSRLSCCNRALVVWSRVIGDSAGAEMDWSVCGCNNPWVLEQG